MKNNPSTLNFKALLNFLSVLIARRVWLFVSACQDVHVSECAFDAWLVAVFVVRGQDSAFCLIIDQRRCTAIRLLSAIIYWCNNNFSETPPTHPPPSPPPPPLHHQDSSDLLLTDEPWAECETARFSYFTVTRSYKGSNHRIQDTSNPSWGQNLFRNNRAWIRFSCSPA